MKTDKEKFELGAMLHRDYNGHEQMLMNEGTFIALWSELKKLVPPPKEMADEKLKELFKKAWFESDSDSHLINACGIGEIAERGIDESFEKWWIKNKPSNHIPKEDEDSQEKEIIIKNLQNYYKSKEEIDIKSLVLKEYANGNVVVSGFDGIKAMALKEFVKQPAEGILYDLNRCESVVLTFIPDPKWVNDYAVAKVIHELKRIIDDAPTPKPENKLDVAVSIQELCDKMWKEYSKWRKGCGHSGWYNMTDTFFRAFFLRYLISSCNLRKAIPVDESKPNEEIKQEVSNILYRRLNELSQSDGKSVPCKTRESVASNILNDLKPFLK